MYTNKLLHSNFDVKSKLYTHFDIKIIIVIILHSLLLKIKAILSNHDQDTLFQNQQYSLPFNNQITDRWLT